MWGGCSSSYIWGLSLQSLTFALQSVCSAIQVTSLSSFINLWALAFFSWKHLTHYSLLSVFPNENILDLTVLLVLKIGSRFFTSLYNPHTSQCSLTHGSLFQVSWSPLEWSFLIALCSQISLYELQLPLFFFWVQLFFLKFLLTIYHTFFSLIFLLRFLVLFSYITVLPCLFSSPVTHLFFPFVCYEFSQRKLLVSDKTSCVSSTWLLSLSCCIAQVIFRAELLLLVKEDFTQLVSSKWLTLVSQLPN